MVLVSDKVTGNRNTRLVPSFSTVIPQSPSLQSNPYPGYETESITTVFSVNSDEGSEDPKTSVLIPTDIFVASQVSDVHPGFITHLVPSKDQHSSL